MGAVPQALIDEEIEELCRGAISQETAVALARYVIELRGEMQRLIARIPQVADSTPKRLNAPIIVHKK
jgi:hypothetical protein